MASRIISDLLPVRAARFGDRTAAVVDGVGSMTYAEWDLRATRAAWHLLERGVAPGDRVAIWVDNTEGLSYLVAYHAVHKAGAVAVPVNTRLTPTEVQRILDHSGAVALVHGSTQDAGSLASPPATVSTAALDALDGDPSPIAVPRAPSDLADILYTSGTTGTAKGVACTHDNILFKGSSQLSSLFGGATLLHAVPLFTFAGTHAMHLICLRGAMTHVLQPRFDPARFWALLQERRVDLAYAVPAMVLRMLEVEPEGAAFADLKLLMYGTAPMPPTAIARLATVFPTTMLINLYGLTEGGAAVCSLSPAEATARPESLGKPMPPTEIRIAGDDGAALGPDLDGEIWMRTGVRTRSYFRDDAATAATWTDDGWVRTGDIGRLDADGYLYLVDRKKDLILVGGHNLSAPEVESVLLEHPAVRDVAVVGTPHPILGEVPRAHVVLGAPAEPSELEAFCRERLADYKVPRAYAFEDELPRNALGKVLKRDLREARP